MTNETREYKVVTNEGAFHWFPTIEQAFAVKDAEFIIGPAAEYPAKGPAFCTCWSLEEGRWEGFISLVS